MAETALKQLEEHLNCSVCLDIYSNPKQLQCFHVYCQQCLVRQVMRDPLGQLILTCPTCRQVTPVPARGVAGLQSAFHINNLLEVLESVKNISEQSIFQEHRNNSISTGVSYCSVHNDKEVELYCETCGELICWKCAFKGGRHSTHNYEELNEAFERYKEEISLSLEPMEKQLPVITEALARFDTCCEDIVKQQPVIEADIHATINQLQEILEVRKTELVSQLHQITQGKLKGLATQREQLETTQAMLTSCLGFMRESLRTSAKEKVLIMKSTIVKEVKDLTNTFQQDIFKPCTEADMTFSTSQGITSACCNCGLVSALNLPDPSKCHLTGKGLEVAVVGEKSTVLLQTVNFHSKLCKEQLQSAKCELISEITGCKVKGTLESRGQSQYEISYQPVIKGRHQIRIEISGQHVRGSPFSVAVKAPLETLGSPILTFSKQKQPSSWGITVTQRGEVVATDKKGECISVFSASGEKLRSFGSFGSRQGEFKLACGVAVDGEGNIIVADCNSHNLQKFTAQGQFLNRVGSIGRGALCFCYPNDVAYNVTNSKFYVVDENDHVQVLNTDFTFSNIFGKRGEGKGQFNYPSSIACDSTGKVFVADSRNHRIQVFTAEGKFLRMFGRRGSASGEMNFPVGIAIDSSNIVYVSEHFNHRISVFTSEGHFVTSLGRKGRGLGELERPRGLAVDSNGVVYVCDTNNCRIQVF